MKRRNESLSSHWVFAGIVGVGRLHYMHLIFSFFFFSLFPFFCKREGVDWISFHRFCVSVCLSFPDAG